MNIMIYDVKTWLIWYSKDKKRIERAKQGAPTRVLRTRPTHPLSFHGYCFLFASINKSVFFQLFSHLSISYISCLNFFYKNTINCNCKSVRPTRWWSSGKSLALGFQGKGFEPHQWLSPHNYVRKYLFLPTLAS